MTLSNKQPRKPLRRPRQQTNRHCRVESLESRQLLAMVSGDVFLDANANGVVDGSDAGAAGIAVVLQNSAGNIVSGPVTTDGAGAYSFNGVADGDYQVAIQFETGADRLQSFPGRLTNPERLGEVLDAFDSPQSPLVDDPTPVGLTWVGNELFTANRAGSDGSNVEKKILGWNGSEWNEKFVAKGATGTIRGLAYDGTSLWVADYLDSKILQYDPTAVDANGNNFPVATFTHPTNSALRPSGITWDGEHFWVVEYDPATSDQTLQKWDIDTVGGSVAVLETLELNVESPFGLEFHDGKLWLAARYATTIHAIDIAASTSGVAVFDESFQVPAEDRNSPTGLAIANDSIWIAQYLDNRVLQLDLGSPEAQAITVSGSDVAVADFGITEYGQVSGHVFEDLDEDGVKDAGEVGAQGWQVYRDENNNGRFDAYEQAAIANANGEYLIDHVLPGSQTIRLASRAPGWSHTTPDSLTQNVSSGDTSTANFGVLQSGFAPAGGEVVVNQTVAGNQGVLHSGVAVNSNGYTAVVFDAPKPGYSGDARNVYLRVLNADGLPVTGEIEVDAQAAGTLHAPVVHQVGSSERFMVGWTMRSSGSEKAFVRTFDQQGNAVTGPIAIEVKNHQTEVLSIDSSATGEIVVLITDQTSRNTVLAAQRFDANGQKVGKPKTIGDPNSSPWHADIALNDDGSYVTAWRNSGEILAQRVDANNNLVGNPIVVQNSRTWSVGIGTDANGGFAIGWQQGNHYEGTRAVKLKYFNASGVQQGAELTMPTDTASDYFGFDMNAAGEIAMTWVDLDDNAGTVLPEVFAQRFRFDADNSQLTAIESSPFQVNTTSAGNQDNPNVALGEGGRMSVVWGGNGPGDDQGVFLQRFTTAGNQAPAAVDDAVTTDQDQLVTISVLSNDTDPNDDTLTVDSVTQPQNGTTLINADGTVRYTPDSGFAGNDTFQYTISDGNGGTDTATVTITVKAPSSDVAMYVDDISFESRTRGKRPTEYRIVVQIRQDSDGDGNGESTDGVLAGVQVTVHFAGTNYTGVTDSNGVFRSSWISDLSSGTYQAEVTDLVLAGYDWNTGLDLEDDTDGDGLPDQELNV